MENKKGFWERVKGFWEKVANWLGANPSTANQGTDKKTTQELAPTAENTDESQKLDNGTTQGTGTTAKKGILSKIIDNLFVKPVQKVSDDIHNQIEPLGGRAPLQNKNSTVKDVRAKDNLLLSHEDLTKINRTKAMPTNLRVVGFWTGLFSLGLGVVGGGIAFSTLPLSFAGIALVPTLLTGALVGAAVYVAVNVVNRIAAAIYRRRWMKAEISKRYEKKLDKNMEKANINGLSNQLYRQHFLESKIIGGLTQVGSSVLAHYGPRAWFSRYYIKSYMKNNPAEALLMMPELIAGSQNTRLLSKDVFTKMSAGVFNNVSAEDLILAYNNKKQIINAVYAGNEGTETKERRLANLDKFMAATGLILPKEGKELTTEKQATNASIIKEYQTHIQKNASLMTAGQGPGSRGLILKADNEEYMKYLITNLTDEQYSDATYDLVLGTNIVVDYAKTFAKRSPIAIAAAKSTPKTKIDKTIIAAAKKEEEVVAPETVEAVVEEVEKEAEVEAKKVAAAAIVAAAIAAKKEEAKKVAAARAAKKEEEVVATTKSKSHSSMIKIVNDNNKGTTITVASNDKNIDESVMAIVNNIVQILIKNKIKYTLTFNIKAVKLALNGTSNENVDAPTK